MTACYYVGKLENMDRDYRLGQRFSECIQGIRPDSQQKLFAIFSDLAGADHEIISAFRLLFCNPLYTSLFLERLQVSPAEVVSLASIAQSSLSPALARRADVFVRGFFGLANDQPASAESPMPALGQHQSQFSSSDRRRVISNHEYTSTASEESTIYSNEKPIREDSDFKPPLGEPLGASHAFSKKANLKLLIFGSLLFLVGVAAFNVPAICEPFGFCEKKGDPVKKDSKKGLSGDVKKAVVTTNQQPPSIPTAQPESALQPPASYPEPRSAAVQPRSIPLDPPISTPPPQNENAPLRSEPLW